MGWNPRHVNRHGAATEGKMKCLDPSLQHYPKPHGNRPRRHFRRKGIGNHHRTRPPPSLRGYLIGARFSSVWAGPSDASGPPGLVLGLGVGTWSQRHCWICTQHWLAGVSQGWRDIHPPSPYIWWTQSSQSVDNENMINRKSYRD